MVKSPKHTTKSHMAFPSKEEILAYIRESPVPVGKREIARAFQITGSHRIALKTLLKDLEKEGAIDRGRGRKLARPGSLPEVMVVEITGLDDDGETLARPMNWPGQQEGFDPPKILILTETGRKIAHRGRNSEAPGAGERCLVRLSRVDSDAYEGRVIKRLQGRLQQVLGVLESAPAQAGALFRLRPTDKKDKNDYNIIENASDATAVVGELVLAEVIPGKPLGLPQARITEIVGHIDQPKAFSLIAIHAHALPHVFSPETLAEAEAAQNVDLTQREDIRHIPLITIDGDDARDFDDAVWAAPDDRPDNPGGFRLLVAIADVSWYVRPGSPLDRDAYERGNSVYFPDRVVPMLPEALSNGLCSLRPEEERGCLAVEITIDAQGIKRQHRFLRGLMRSAARLTYDQVQKAQEGFPDPATAPLLAPIITPLYGAYAALALWRKKRGTLELDLAERKVKVGEDGKVAEIVERERFDSHRLIEEFMILANVCAAETLEKHHSVCMYRLHDRPSFAKIEALRDALDGLDYSLQKGDLRPHHFNQLLSSAKGKAEADMVNQLVLRSQAQAVYGPENIGHFGLSLQKYAHFTSPIRRYADLLVHRALVSALKLGEGGLPESQKAQDALAEKRSRKNTTAKKSGLDFQAMGEHISITERRAAIAERDAIDRYAAAYMSERIGAEFKGRISTVGSFGMFIRLTDSGAEGLAPMGQLPGDYYIHDEANHALIGERTRHIFRLGDSVTVRLLEADAITGRMLFHLLDGGTSLNPGSEPSKRKALSPPGRVRKQRGKSGIAPKRLSSRSQRRGKKTSVNRKKR